MPCGGSQPSVTSSPILSRNGWGCLEWAICSQYGEAMTGRKRRCGQIERCCGGGLLLRDPVILGQNSVSEAERWRLTGLLVPPPVDPAGGPPRRADAGAAKASDQVSVVSPGSRNSGQSCSGSWSAQEFVPSPIQSP